MPIVKRPGKQVAPSFGTPAVIPEAGLKRAAQLPGAIKQQAGAGLVALGGDFAELALRVHSTKVREEFEDAKIAYDEDVLSFLAEQEKEQNFLDWEQNTAQKHDSAASTIEGKMRMPKAREQFSQWAQAERSVLMYKTVTRADRLSADKARSMIRVRLENAVKQNRLDDFMSYLTEMEEDGLLAGEEVGFWLAEMRDLDKRWRHSQTLMQVETEAISILNEVGVDAAVIFIKGALTDPALAGADIRSLTNLVEFMDRVNQYVDKRDKREAKRKEITQFTTLIGEGKLDPRLVENSEHGVSHQQQWKKYLKNSVKVVPEIDWRKFLELQDNLFDHWNVDQTEYELAVVEARYGDKAYINDEAYDRLLKRPVLDMPRQYMVTLRAGFEAIYRAGSKWKFGLRDLNQEEAQRVAQAQSALLDWLLEDRVSKKKETSPTEFYARALELAALFKPGAITPPALRLPLDKLEDYLTQFKDAKPADLMYDLRNAARAVREGRDANLVFQRILDTYKDRKELQEFLATYAKPFIIEKE